jgi:hypothetical protein
MKNKLLIFIGQKVSKSRNKSRNKIHNIKPFKSRLMFNTVKGVETNPNTNKLAFTFFEDDSLVDIRICKFEDQHFNDKFSDILDDIEIEDL